MKNNRVDACRELYRGSFKKANIVACCAGTIALAVLVPAEMADYLPDHMSTVRIMLIAVMVYGKHEYPWAQVSYILQTAHTFRKGIVLTDYHL